MIAIQRCTPDLGTNSLLPFLWLQILEEDVGDVYKISIFDTLLFFKYVC